MKLLYTVIAPPATLAVSVADCKQDLRLETSFTLEDDLIESYIVAASKYASEVVGRKLVSETIKYSIENTDYCGNVKLPFMPVSSISEIQYYDSDNASQTLDANDFYLYNYDNESVLVPKTNTVWPTIYNRRDAINITFVAGYGNATDIPPTITKAIRLLVAHWYENRTASVVGVSITDLPFAVENLLNSERRGWVA